jgi:arylsulfatase A-like enzyme
MSENIIIISIDSLRADGTNYNRELIYGKGKHQRIKTPNLDKFSKAGTSFIKAYSTNTYTTSAHASLFTGTYPPEHGIRTFFDFNQRLNPKTKTMAEELSTKGYQTFFYSDVKELFSEMNIWKGFRVKTYGKSDWLWNSIEEFKKDKNFIFLHLFDVHEPYLYIEDESADEKVNQDYYQAVDDLRNELGIKSKLNQKKNPHDSWEEIKQFLIKNNLDHQQYLKKYYDLGVEEFDKRIKLILERFTDLGFDLNKDLFILLSDHGEGRTEFDKSKSFAHGGSLTEETLRIFFTINIELSSVNSSLISIKDVKKMISFFSNEEKISIENNGLYAEHSQWNQRTTTQDSKDKIGIKNIKSFLSEQAFISNDSKIIINLDQNQYFDIFTKLEKNSEVFIDKTYNFLLNRFPDIEGKNNSLSMIENRSKGNFLNSIINSQEFKNRKHIQVFNTQGLKDSY